MRRNLNWVCECFESTIPSYFPDKFKSFSIGKRRPQGNGFGWAVISPSKQILALEHWNCWVVAMVTFNLVLGETGPRRNGRMEQNFPVIPVFGILGQPCEVPLKFRNVLSIRSSPGISRRNFWSNGKRSLFPQLYLEIWWADLDIYEQSN